MLIKTNFTQQERHGVAIGTGIVSFQGVRMAVHCFIADGVLIDTGAASLKKGFTDFFSRQPIDQAVITHYHEDHTGCAAFVRNELGLPLYMNGRMLDYCGTKADYPLYRKVFWGKREPFRAEAISRTFSSQNAAWDVIETPGHAIDHLAFLNRETGQLFTGDLFCQEKMKVALREESVPVIIESLIKVLTYEFSDVFCSHAGFVGDGRGALRRKLEYLLDLQGNIIRLHEEGWEPADIRRILLPKNTPSPTFQQANGARCISSSR